jgi:hypothetical protein
MQRKVSVNRQGAQVFSYNQIKEALVKEWHLLKSKSCCQ